MLTKLKIRNFKRFADVDIELGNPVILIGPNNSGKTTADRLFAEFVRKLGLPNLLQKTDYHVLARYVPRELIDPEVIRVLDDIVDFASQAMAADVR